jgi:hypothetical protein
MGRELKLTIELVPHALWGQSIAHKYPRQWRELREQAYANAGHRCEICGHTAQQPIEDNGWITVKDCPDWNLGGLEAHEIWQYEIDGNHGVQRLIRIIALCPRCHQCKHMGRSRRTMPTHEYRKVIDHFLTVNGISIEKYYIHLAEVQSRTEYQLTLEWSQDLSKFIEVDDE